MLISLVVFRYDGGLDPGDSRGWCFDFATEKQVSVTEMLQRMGLDPDEVQAQMQRQAMQTFDRHMGQGGYYEGLLSGGNLASMRMKDVYKRQGLVLVRKLYHSPGGVQVKLRERP